MGTHIPGLALHPEHHVAQHSHCQEHGHTLKYLLGAATELAEGQKDNRPRHQADPNSAASPQPDTAELISPLHHGQIGKDDADDQRCLQSLPQSNQERTGHTEIPLPSALRKWADKMNNSAPDIKR